MTSSATQLSDAALLEAFVKEKSQDAFAQIVARHGAAVYSAARRQLRDASLADDVTQAVFILLMRRASSIGRPDLLAGWLMRTTRFCVLNARRGESRRAEHEAQAAKADAAPALGGPALSSDVLPLVDEAIARLNAVDRAIVTLSLLESRSLTEIGALLQMSADAIRKRLPRAIDKIRRELSRQGIAVSAETMALALAPMTAPSELTLKIIGAHGHGTTAAHTIANAVGKKLAAKTALSATAIGAAAVAVLLGGAATAYYVHTNVAFAPLPGPVRYSNGQPGNVYASPNNPAAGWSASAVSTTPKTQSPFLGPFGNQNVALSVADLPKHDFVRIHADLYIMQSWDGVDRLDANLTPSGPDFWTMRLNDRPALVRATFSATPDTGDFAFACKLQSFPAVIPSDPHAAGTGAYGVNTLGYFDNFRTNTNNALRVPMDGAYHLDFTLPHSADTLTLTVGGDGLSGIADESWGITNVKIDALSASNVAKLSGDQFQTLWLAMTGPDPVASRDAFWQLVAGSDATVDFLARENTPAPFRAADVRSRLAQLPDNDPNVAFNARQDLIAMGPAIETLLPAAGVGADDAPMLRSLLEAVELRPITDPAQRIAAAKARLLAAINTPAAKAELSRWLDAGQSWQPDTERRFQTAYHLPDNVTVQYVDHAEPGAKDAYLQHRRTLIASAGFKDSYIHDELHDWTTMSRVFILADATPNLWTPAYPVYLPGTDGWQRLDGSVSPVRQLLNEMQQLYGEQWQPVMLDSGLDQVQPKGDWLIRRAATSEAAHLKDLATELSRVAGRTIQARAITLPGDEMVLSGQPSVAANPPVEGGAFPALDLYVDAADRSADAVIQQSISLSSLPALLRRYGQRVRWEMPLSAEKDVRVQLRYHPGALRTVTPSDAGSADNLRRSGAIFSHLAEQLHVDIHNQGKPTPGYQLRFID